MALDLLANAVPIPEAAALLHISRHTVEKWLSLKRLRRVKCGSRTLVDKRELATLLKVEK